jgi:hypothetical protein
MKHKHSILDEHSRNAKTALAVIPAKAGIQFFHPIMDSGFRRSDDDSELSEFLICSTQRSIFRIRAD